MDIKGANIMVSSSGNWHLIDYETMVQQGFPVIGYTKTFYPELLVTTESAALARVEFDWYMLLVTILVEITKPHWKDSLLLHKLVVWTKIR